MWLLRETELPDLSKRDKLCIMVNLVSHIDKSRLVLAQILEGRLLLFVLCLINELDQVLIEVSHSSRDYALVELELWDHGALVG